MAYSTKTAIYDQASNKEEAIDGIRNLRVAQLKRIIGTNFGSSIDSAYYTITNNNAGTTTAATGTCTLATNTTANGNTQIVSVAKARNHSGRTNIFRGVIRFGDTGGTNNVREFGIYVDANNAFVFRLSGTTFSVVVKRAGVETVVNSGSFNGNGTTSGGTYALDTNFHAFSIGYMASRIRFEIDDTSIHVFSAGSTNLVASLVGQLYASNVNSGGATTNRVLDLIAWSVSASGDAVNNPQFYNCNAVAETRTLKGGGGTLQSISIGRSGGTGATLTLYDNTAASGTIIGIWDLNAATSVGTHVMGLDGVNFYLGLSYQTTGTMTGASVTFFWD